MVFQHERKGDIDAWATYGYAMLQRSRYANAQAKKAGAKVLKSAKDILSGNFLIVAAPSAIADPNKKAAISDFLCRLKKSQVWQTSNLKDWSKNYAQTIGVDEAIVYEDAKQGQEQRPSQLLPTSDNAIASQQQVADTFTDSGVLKSKVDVKTLWDNSFNQAIDKCN